MSVLDNITSEIQNYVVAPLAAFGIGGFVFDVQADARSISSADITDHWAEDNRALQDHIAIKPKRITLKGYVGELVYNPPGNGTSVLQNVAQKLIVANSYLPQLSNAATEVQQAIADPSSITVSQAINEASNIYGIVKNMFGAIGSQARQQNAYNYFESLMNSGTLMAIQTPWAFLTSMAIESIAAVQDEGTIYISEFSVTFKKINIAKTKTTAFSSGLTGIAAPIISGLTTMTDLPSPSLSAIAAAQAAPTVTQGNVAGVSLPSSLLSGAQGIMTGVKDFASGPLKSIWGN